MVHELSAAASDLVHAEINLAEAKFAQRVNTSGPAIMMLGAAGSFAFIALLTVMFAFGAWLATMLSTVAAAFIVAAVCLVISALLMKMGKERFARTFGGRPVALGKRP
ncbi:phage holin family protein [Pacificimonas sp. WHA3]|uniref:Phage holin family protein n=1 Tax=Pacificimonas pallii TaxID=2827236 RepID=A0ABS6SF61_9SPHN|nr:phage holin family protein [Pacificimonas pallii]MBV7256561.1 phage holin family protein [Pacificimonas pallii]